MQYWKLGCDHWGDAGTKNFYDLLKKRSIVICADREMKKGDIVAIARGFSIIALARIREEPVSVTNDPAMEAELAFYGIDYEDWNQMADAEIWDIDQSDQIKYQARKGICRIGNSEVIEAINAVLCKRKKSEMIDNYMKYINEYKKTLEFNHNLILTGAPGTGKTFLAKEIAENVTGDLANVEMVQFHPSYDYTDFVEGLRPVDQGNGSIGFQRQDGIFKAFCKRALQDKEEKKYVFIIDEINRGEISKIFGELFFSIDPGYRGQKGQIKTQYQNLVSDNDAFKNGFYIPENVYIIGTMNDIDRSVDSMDFAMRRRFTWREVTAESSQAILDMVSAWQPGTRPDDAAIEEIKIRMDNLNAAIIDAYSPGGTEQVLVGLSEEYQIGAAYFLKYGKYNDFEKLWKYHLEGVLREYLRGQPDIKEKIDFLKKAYDDTADHRNS